MSVKSLAMRDVLLERIWEGMATDNTIFFATADFGSPVLDKIRADFPDRFVNVGIAEQNLINISAGLALEGFTVFAYAIAPFITMRCYEQIRVNLALLSKVRPMNVNLIGVGAGYSYVVSGPTHQCYEDITLMRVLPGVEIFSPADHVCAAELFGRCINTTGPKYLRLDAQLLPVLYDSITPSLAKGFHVHKIGTDVCLVATGYMVHTALEAADGLAAAGYSVGVIDLFAISGFAINSLIDILSACKGIVTLEEGFIGRGGMDSIFFEIVTQQNLPLRVLNIGVKCAYHFELGTRAELHEQTGIDSNAVLGHVTAFIKSISA